MGFERGAIFALLRRPLLLFEAVRTSVAMRRNRGLGLAAAYLAWRQSTAYGENVTTVSVRDMLDYLSWRRGLRRIRKWEREA